MTLRALMGLLPGGARITGGRVQLGGEGVRAAEVRGTRIGMVFQEPSLALNPVYRVGDQIAEGPLRAGGLSAKAARQRSHELMDLVGIPDARNRARAFPHELSGGLRQRVMIAIALAGEPEVVLCDEPTTALDVTIQDQVLRLLLRLASDLGVAMVLVTHDLAVVAETCANTLVMYAGRVVESGPTATLFAEPRHPYTLGLLRSVPELGAAKNSLVPIPGAPPTPGTVGDTCAFAPRCAFADAACVAAMPPLLQLDDVRATACWRHEVLGG